MESNGKYGFFPAKDGRNLGFPGGVQQSSGNVEVGWGVHLKSGELMAGESGDGMGLWKRIKQEMLS